MLEACKERPINQGRRLARALVFQAGGQERKHGWNVALVVGLVRDGTGNESGGGPGRSLESEQNKYLTLETMRV